MSSISAGTTVNTGLVYTSDTSGTLQIKTGASAVTAISIDASQNVGIGASSMSGSGNLFIGGLYSSIYYNNASGSFNVGTYTNTPMTFGTNNTIRATIDTSGNFQFNSGYGSVATAYGCRAWVNFNGTGTVAIRGSGNVSSITDNGVGLYVVNLTNSLPDTNGAVLNGGCFSNAQSTTEVSALLTNISTTSAVQISAFNTTTGGRHDATYVMVGVQR
jgi:hypothetical protein